MPVTFLKKIQNAKDLVQEYLNRYPRNGIALSFGKDSMVLTHLAIQVKPDVMAFSVLSDTEFPETLALRDKVVQDWKLNYKEYVFHNDPALGTEHCCREAKVGKFKEAVANLDCWFSAIRRDEGFTRTDFQYVEEKDGLVKINPLLDFTEKDIWHYTAAFGVPASSLYGMGFRSLSCRTCSAKEQDENEPERAGRWVGTSNEGGECGIHTQSLRESSRAVQAPQTPHEEPKVLKE